MANGVIKRSVLVLAVAVCVGLLGGAGFAQGDRVLVGGSPALRQSDLDKSLEALEFFFQMKFSAPEKPIIDSALKRRGARATIR